MKFTIFILCAIGFPAFAQSNYYDNRFSPGAVAINQPFNSVNGYYYNKSTNQYYKGKNINRDSGAQPSPQGSLSFTYDRNRYAPTNLTINR